MYLDIQGILFTLIAQNVTWNHIIEYQECLISSKEVSALFAGLHKKVCYLGR